MATFDDIARMRAQLMAEKRGRMARHPQQVAGAVNQGADALARMAQYLQQKQIAADRITAAGARADADRKQRAAAAKAAAKQRADAEQAKIDANAPVRESTVTKNLAAAGASEASREKTLAHEDVLRVLGTEAARIAAEPQGEAWEFSADELEAGEAMPDGDGDLPASPAQRIYDRLGPRGLTAYEQRLREAERLGLDTTRQRAEIDKLRAQADSARASAAKKRRGPSAAARERQRKKDELLDLQIDEKKRILTEGKELPEDKVSTAKAATTIKLMRAARELKKGVNTGPLVQQGVELAREWVPFVEFKGRRPFETVNAALGRTLAKYIEEGRLTDPDAEFYAKKLISGELNDHEYEIALDVVEKYLVGAVEDKLNVYEGQRYNVRPHRKALDDARSAPLESLPGMGGRGAKTPSGGKSVRLERSDTGQRVRVTEEQAREWTSKRGSPWRRIR